MNRAPGILKAIFSTLRYTCRIDWNITEWRFRVSLDMYIIHTGMLAAILYVQIADAWNAITQLWFVSDNASELSIPSVQLLYYQCFVC